MSFLVQPSRLALVRAQEEVWHSLLDDITAISKALAQNVPTYDDTDIVLLARALRSVSVVPELFAWYFSLLDHLGRNDVDSAVAAMWALGNCVALPLYERRDLDPPHEKLHVPLAVRDSKAQFPQLTTPLSVGSETSLVLTPDGLFLAGEQIDTDALLREHRFQHEGSEFWCDGEVVRGGLSEILGEEQADHSQAITLSPISRDWLQRYGTLLERVARGRFHVRSAWPELADEMECVMHAFVLLRGSQFVAGSSLRLPGVIWLRMDPQWSDLAFADHLVHEAAHCTLFVGTELQPLILNPNLVCPSPIRRQQRPLLGTVHATFVFQRLVGFFGRLIRSSSLSPEGFEEAEARLHRHALGLMRGTEIIRQHADLTTLGVTWVETLETMIVEEIADLRPLPEVAARISGDYDRLDAASAFGAGV